MMQIISATRQDQNGFMRSPLGLSLRRMQSSEALVERIFYSNTRGLSTVYNDVVDSAHQDDILVFTHDDVWIDDYFLPARVLDGLARFQVLGVAGNIGIPNDHVGWAFREGLHWYDRSMLRGAVAHGGAPFGNVSAFGHTAVDARFATAASFRSRDGDGFLMDIESEMECNFPHGVAAGSS